MRTGLLIALALVLLVSFAGEARAAEPWAADLAVKECKQVTEPTEAVGTAGALEGATFMATQCSSVADCMCPYEPSCYCAGICICNFRLCCIGPNCP